MATNTIRVGPFMDRIALIFKDRPVSVSDLSKLELDLSCASFLTHNLSSLLPYLTLLPRKETHTHQSTKVVFFGESIGQVMGLVFL